MTPAAVVTHTMMMGGCPLVGDACSPHVVEVGHQVTVCASGPLPMPWSLHVCNRAVPTTLGNRLHDIYISQLASQTSNTGSQSMVDTNADTSSGTPRTSPTPEEASAELTAVPTTSMF